VRRSRATCLHYLGVMPAMLMKAPDGPADRDHSVRFGFGAGAPAALHGAFEQRFGFPLIEAWAMTETGSGGVISVHREPRKVGTACFGRPDSGVEIRIVDDAGDDVDIDAPGELLVRRAGPDPAYGFFREYLANPAATAEAWAGGGSTPAISSRATPTVTCISSIARKRDPPLGENIAAVEVETILARHPHVRQVAVAATPDPVRGDEVAALIVLDAPARAGQTRPSSYPSTLHAISPPGHWARWPTTRCRAGSASSMRCRARRPKRSCVPPSRRKWGAHGAWRVLRYPRAQEAAGMSSSTKRSRMAYDGVVVAAPITVPYQRFSSEPAHGWAGAALRALAGSEARPA
jgi:hypothetical protein